mgnify:CR=1 FL=1
MNKKNKSVSIYKDSNNVMDTFRRNTLTKVIKYRVDGEVYAETIDLDIANGTFGRTLGIEKVKLIGNIFTEQKIVYIPVTNQEELDKIQLDSARMNEYGTFITDIKAIDGADEALDASNMKVHADSQISWDNIPLPKGTDTGEVKESDSPNKIKPKDIFGDYKEIFKRHLKYPRDMFTGGEIRIPFANADPTQGSQDYLFIEQFSYKAPQFNKGKVPANMTTKEMEGLIGNTLKQGTPRGTNISEPMGSCILPVPNRLGVSQGVNWGEGRANAVELSAFQAVSGATGKLLNKNKEKGGGLINLLTEGTNQATSIFNTVSEQLRNQDGTANAGAVINATIARSLLSRVGINVDVEQFITRETGAAINPNLELLFGGPQLRTFSFLFNFAPNDKEEAREVRMIQRWFRQGMLAQKTTNFGNGGSLFLGSPNVFRVCYKNNKRRIKGLNTFKICAVTSVEVDFTPDGVYQSYEDEKAVSMPVRSTMKVTFNELTPIFANDYNLDEELDPSIEDIKPNVTDTNKFTEDDLGF